MTLENATIPTTTDAQPEPVSVRDDVLAAFKEAEAPAQVESEEQKAERLRDEQGRFAKADEKKPDAKIEAPATAEPKTSPDAKTEIRADVREIAPPVEWKGNAKIDWNRLPASVRQAISDEYGKFTDASRKVEALDKILTPQRRQQLVLAYGNDMSGLDQILNAVEYSNKDPVGFLKWYIQSNRIDISSLVSQPQQQQQPAADPQLQQLLTPVLNEVSSLKQMFQQRQSFEEQQAQSQIQQELNAFFADHVNYPYAQDVRQHMGALINSGQAKGLKDAYDQAVWANPSTRSQLLAQQAQQSTQTLQSQAQQKRQLSASVTGAPGTAQPLNGITNPKATVREDVLEAFRQSSGRM